MSALVRSNLIHRTSMFEEKQPASALGKLETSWIIPATAKSITYNEQY